MQKKPNILILMPDQFRADTMGCAGHPIIKTPNLDRLAQEGVRFSASYTASPVCMSARASFVSGTYPHNHQIWNNSGSLPANDETYFQHLQQSGYYTAYIGKSHFYPHGGKHMKNYEDYMHARGLDYVNETTGPWATTRTDSYMTDHWKEKGLLSAFREDYAKRRENGPCSVWTSPLPTEEFMDSYIGRMAVEFTESYNNDKPICLFVGFGGPHEPWDAPGEYATMYDPDDVPPPIPKSEPEGWVPELAAQRMEKHAVIEGMTEEDVRKIGANYYGKISLIDRWIGEIVKAFERRGWLDNTFVVFWSDHGEMLGDHHRLHKSVFYDSSVRVPLILRYPGMIEAGTTSDALTGIIDVYPTLLEAVGAEPSKRCLGRSLWPVLNGDETSHREAVFSEIFSFGHYNVMLQTDRYKYAMDDTGNGYLLFDTQEDPTEQRNLIGHPDVCDVEPKLREQLIRFWIGNQCRYRGVDQEIH